jgi:hypothetical protein
MGGVQEKFAAFWNNPMGDRTAGDYFLFIGLLILIIYAWSRILKVIEEGI